MIGFPVVLLLFFQVMILSIGLESLEATPQFEINSLSASISIFGFSFLTLFTGMLISKDRTSSFIVRLRTTPMTNNDFIFGYVLPMIPIALTQVLICFLTALFFGLKFSLNLLLAIVVLFPSAVMFISLGVLIGCLFSDKAVGGIASLIVNLAVILSGMFFPLRIMKGAFVTIAYIFPFAHAVDLASFAILGQYSKILKPLIIVVIYTVILLAISLLVFRKKLTSDKT
jgi:ABC-2 type transport system permease protein